MLSTAQVHQASGDVTSAGLDSKWYAIYTCANHERKVLSQLEERCVMSFLPVYESVRRWKDRRMQLELPLFPGYVFVRIALADRLRVLQVPSVVSLVGFNGNPCPLPEEEIEALKKGLATGVRAAPHPYLTVGRRVQIKNGPLQGMHGVLLRTKRSLQLVISVELIMRSVVVEIDAADVAVLHS